jgi:hypothetical protein
MAVFMHEPFNVMGARTPCQYPLRSGIRSQADGLKAKTFFIGHLSFAIFLNYRSGRSFS